jgi:hypothetical protein
MGKMSELDFVVKKLRQAAQAITDAADSLAACAAGTGTATDAPAAPQVEPPKPKPIALEDVRAVLAEKSRSGHTAAVQELLRKHGAGKLSAIDPAKYSALLADAADIGEDAEAGHG